MIIEQMTFDSITNDCFNISNLPHPRYQLLHHFKSSGAIVDILFMHMSIFAPFPFGKMGKTCAVHGSYFVDRTFVIGKV